MGSATVLRAASSGDVSAACALLGEVFGANPKADPAVWTWQHVDHPLGPAGAVLAEFDGEVVGHAGWFTAPGQVRGLPLRLAHTGDAAVHPDHRGQGVYGRLVTARAAAAADAGAAASMIVPNAASRPALERAGWRGHDARAWVAPVDPVWFAQVAHLPRPVATSLARVAFAGARPDGEVTPLGDLDELDALWAGVAADHPSGFVRDAAWWRWRYVARPHGAYGLVGVRRGGRLVAAAAGAVAERAGAPFCHVMELLAVDARAGRAALRGLVDVLGPVAALTAVAVPRTPQARQAARLGLRPVPRRAEPAPMGVGAILHGALQGTAAPRWSITWGDHDHL